MSLPIGIPQIILGDVQTSSKGQKSIPISYANDQGDRVFIFPGKLEVPFNPSAFQQPEASRLNLCFTPSDEFKTLIGAIDEQLRQQLLPRLKEAFGNQVDELNYHSPLKDAKNGYQHVRTKINLDGKGALRCWNTRKQLQAYPEDWTSVSVSPRIWVKSIYILGKECGLTLECLDISVDQKQITCPF